jgi:hypothetical protein
MIFKYYDDAPILNKYLKDGTIYHSRIAEILIADWYNGVLHVDPLEWGSDLTIDDELVEVKVCFTAIQYNNISNRGKVSSLNTKRGNRLIVMLFDSPNDSVYCVDLPTGIWETHCGKAGTLSFSISEKKQLWWQKYARKIDV